MIFTYFHNAFLSLLIGSISIFLIGSIKDYHLTIKEIDNNIIKNDLWLTTMDQQQRLKRLLDCLNFHRQLIKYGTFLLQVLNKCMTNSKYIQDGLIKYKT